MLSKIIEFVEGGFLAQTALVVIVWGAIAFLAITQKAIPDPLLDAGFVIIGFYFRSAVSQQSKSGTGQG